MCWRKRCVALRRIEGHLVGIERMMATNQEHLNSVLASFSESLTVIVTELKDHANNGETLDFTAADALVVAAAQAATALPDPPADPPVA